MSDRPDAMRPLKITDPNREAVRFIDQATIHGGSGPLINLTLCTVTPVPVSGTDFVAEAVVTARLRFDLDLAKALVEGIGRQIARVESLQAEEHKQARNKLRSVVN